MRSGKTADNSFITSCNGKHRARSLNAKGFLNVRNWRISLKKVRGGAFSVSVVTVFEISIGKLFATAAPRAPSWAAYAAITSPAGRSRASRRRFCAVAASRNSSLAPHGPRSRRRPSRNMRLRWANNISTFFRLRQTVSNSGVPASARATSRESSSISRGIFRTTASGQHFALSSQTSQSFLLAR
jgi:hypothetical protein